LEENKLNKNQKTTFAMATLIVIIIALIASIYYFSGTQPQNALLPSGQPPQTQLKVSGDIASEKTLSINDLTQMTAVSVTSTIKGETATYVGVTLIELLNKTDASWDTGALNVFASDGFNKTLTVYQAFNSTQYPGSEIILAYAKNGNWITDTSEGPLKLIAPGLASSFNVKSVAEIRLQPWTINVSGAVANSIAVSNSNLSSFEAKTVHAAFAPGGEPQRTSDWTGVTVWSVLQASGVSPSATKITVTAIDGYSREYTIAQVQSTDMLIGFKENGAYLSYAGGQPYRLMVPTEDLKWGQNWVRWVSEITVT
jgi:DMSO/TMAO reductase YedYZ molybdopterin-dependent catalytic subunit